MGPFVGASRLKSRVPTPLTSDDGGVLCSLCTPRRGLRSISDSEATINYSLFMLVPPTEHARGTFELRLRIRPRSAKVAMLIGDP